MDPSKLCISKYTKLLPNKLRLLSVAKLKEHYRKYSSCAEIRFFQTRASWQFVVNLSTSSNVFRTASMFNYRFCDDNNLFSQHRGKFVTSTPHSFHKHTPVLKLARSATMLDRYYLKRSRPIGLLSSVTEAWNGKNSLRKTYLLTNL